MSWWADEAQQTLSLSFFLSFYSLALFRSHAFEPSSALSLRLLCSFFHLISPSSFVTYFFLFLFLSYSPFSHHFLLSAPPNSDPSEGKGRMGCRLTRTKVSELLQVCFGSERERETESDKQRWGEKGRRGGGRGGGGWVNEM